MLLYFSINEYGSKMTGLFPGFTKVLHFSLPPKYRSQPPA